MHQETTIVDAHTMNRRAKYAIRSIVIALAMIFVLGAQAQSRIGRIAFGIEGGGNKYYGDYTDNQFALHGAAFIRWNIRPDVSLHVQYNGGQLKYKATEASILNSGGGPVNSVNHTRVGGWDALLSYNFFPEETFVPYVIAGIEILNFEPNDAGDAPLRGNAAAAYSKDVVGGALGVGFEMYISEKITFNGKGLLHLTGTDWIDDYSHPVTYRQDAFLTMGVGFSYYIFAPEIVPAVASGDGSVTNITNNTYNTYESSYETVVYHTDTIYRSRPEVNAVYNFPGTLFIVNTDEFNTNEPGNMANLQRIKTLVNQCPGIRVEIQGHASNEGTAERNQELSDMRAVRVKNWLIAQGVAPSKITNAIGFGTRDNAVREPTGVSAEKLEAARVYNRRIAVKVIETCN